MNKVLFWLLLVFAGIGVFIVFRSQPDSTDTKTNLPSQSENRNITETADFSSKPTLIIGNEDAEVTLVEYLDFKCPNCIKWHYEAGSEIKAKYIQDGRVNLEIRNYPFIGPDSGRAARGTYCANDQGVFQQYHDRTIAYMWENYYKRGDLSAESKDVLTVEVLSDLVSDILNDANRFTSCLQSDEYNRFIDADLLLGADDGINGTPGFTVGAQKIIGPQPFSTFKTLLDIQLR